MKKNSILSRRGLLYQLKQDIFGTFVISKPLSSRLNRNLLSRFENFLRRRVLRPLRKSTAVFEHRTDGYKNRGYWKFPPTLQKHFKPLNNIFFKLLFKYSTTKKIFTPQQNRLLFYWVNSSLFRLRKKVPTTLYHFNNRNYYASGKKTPRFRFLKIRTRTKVELLKIKHFYNFPNLRITTNYLKKLEYGGNSYTRFGISSSLIHLLFRTNMFLNSRSCYFLIKSGGVLVNNIRIYNPYKLLKVSDHFSVDPRLIFYLFTLLNYRINRRLLVNIPNFIDFNYKIMNFKIWRLPTKSEIYFSYNFPFQRPSSVNYKFLNIIKNKYKKN